MDGLTTDGYELVEVTKLGDPAPRYIRGRCMHIHTEPVDLALTGEVVAQLCTACWQQLPAGFVSRYATPSLCELNSGFSPGGRNL